MIRTILLASAMTIATPVLAQTAAPTTQTAPAVPAAPAATVPGQAATAPQAAPAQTAPVQTVPATTAQTQPAPATAADPAQPAVADAAQPAVNSTDQVAQAVDTQFGTYDKNADGKLDKVEFSAWMVALKTASDPATKADSAETKKWVGAAFAQADKDKNRSLDKTEVAGFLAQGKS